MRTVTNTVIIDATPGEVWRVLTDFARYGEWNPFVREVRGVLERGTELTFRISLGPDRQMTSRAVVRDVQPQRYLSWGGGMPLGLVRGLHSFELTALPDGGTRLVDQEQFTGPLVPAVLGRRRLAAQQQAFAAFDLALKRRVENNAQPVTVTNGKR